MTMGTHTQILYHIVFGTYKRKPTMTLQNKHRLYSYINELLKNKNCHLYRINGIENHFHVLTHIHPTISLATLVKDIKLASSAFIKETGIFPHFEGWQEGYGAFTVSYRSKDRLIDYIINQEKHHNRITFQEEYIQLLEEFQVKFDPNYLL